VTLIASAAGRPQDIVVDYFIDNGAPSPGAEHGRINALANVTLGWMWCCEYVSAMTREGKIPGILISVALPGAEEYDAKIQTPEGRHKINPCDTPVPPGRLAEVYLKRIEKAIADLKTPRIQDQVRKAADIAAARMAAGETVGLSALGHLIIFEVMEDDAKAPWKQFFGIHGNDIFERTMKPGELLVWIAYMGMDSAYASYGERIEKAKVDLITSYAPPLEPAAPPARQLAHIEQPWEAGDAVVPLPCEPGSMAPASGIISTLIFRMLDDEVAARLAPPGQSASPAAVRRASRQAAAVAHY